MFNVVSRALAAMVLVVLGACGGGGGDERSSGSAPSGKVTIQFVTLPIDLIVLEGESARAQFNGVVLNDTNHTIYIGLRESAGFIDDVVDIQTFAPNLSGTIVFKDLAAGVYQTELSLHACADDACHAEEASPARLPIKLTVLPNIKISGTTTLQRTGREPAPAVSLALSVPSPAGAVGVQVERNDGAFEITLQGDELRVQTNSFAAGTYRATATVYSIGNPRYRKSVDLVYTVLAPPGGQVPLSVALTGNQHLSLAQGAKITQRVKITQPSWTDDFDEPVIDNPNSGFSLKAIGNDEYELTADASNKLPGLYFTQIYFRAGRWGGSTNLFVSMDVGALLSLPSGLSTRLTIDSSLADLQMSSSVLTADGTAAHWAASTSVPWLKLINATGTTGVDALVVEVDPAALAKLPIQAEAEILISVDRPGTLPFKTWAVVANEIPRLDAAGAKVMVGNSGTVYIAGAIPNYYTSPMNWSALRVQGATLAKASVVADSRFLSLIAVLKFDFTDAVPGRDIIVGIDAPLMSSQVTIAVEAPVSVPTGYAPLPYDAYRPARYAAGMDSLYFASPGRAHRWSHAAGTWQMTSQAVAGLIDLAPSPDEQQIHAVATSQVIALQPTSLAEVGRSNFYLDPIFPNGIVDANLSPSLNAFVYSADYRAFASKRYIYNGIDQGAVVGWLRGNSDTDLMQSPHWADPGSGFGSLLSAGILRSAGGHTLITVLPERPYRLYSAAQRLDSSGSALPAGVLAVAVNDAGTRVIGSDGKLYAQSLAVANLSALLPADRWASAYGLSGDGRFALIYAYRIAVEGGSQRARDAALWVIDLRTAEVGTAAVVATVPLQDAVGCTVALVGAEPCLHQAAITVTDGFGSAFVLGPRGVAAVALPDVGQASAAKTLKRAQRVPGNGPRMLGPLTPQAPMR